jgi:hypothetical protein
MPATPSRTAIIATADRNDRIPYDATFMTTYSIAARTSNVKPAKLIVTI